MYFNQHTHKSTNANTNLFDLTFCCCQAAFSPSTSTESYFVSNCCTAGAVCNFTFCHFRNHILMKGCNFCEVVRFIFYVPASWLSLTQIAKLLFKAFSFTFHVCFCCCCEVLNLGVVSFYGNCSNVLEAFCK